MTTHLDLDDVCAGHPKAQEELITVRRRELKLLSALLIIRGTSKDETAIMHATLALEATGVIPKRAATVSEPIKLQDSDYFPADGHREMLRLVFGQATAELRAERDALVAATGASSVLEAIGIIRGNKAELDRLTTLRPASEHDTQNEALWWYSPDDFRDASFFRSAPYWTPLPDVKEAK